PLTAPSPTALYPLSLHDALPISALQARGARLDATLALARLVGAAAGAGRAGTGARGARRRHASGAGQRALWGLGGVHPGRGVARSEEHTSELQSLAYLVCRLLLE